eukprot:TRINITY_DN70_c3_g5_i1.p1 TRINITY_DN70_c3_g5~~TRINITY_DN70_c3_g5_i1.p1  ORF type:complete len:180 (+),score=78.50 TRINITY_DN70_c3_g5_i1:154-693(+)
MAYHSGLNGSESAQICGFGVFPLKTKIKGPAPPQMNATAVDIIDETIEFFRANVLFRNYEIKGAGDRLLIYLTLYTHHCLCRITGKPKDEAVKQLYQLAIENFSIPGDAGFVLGGLVPNPTNRAEGDQCRQYFTQLRQELGLRLVDKVYTESNNQPSKWWICWTKRRFLNKSLDPTQNR